MKKSILITSSLLSLLLVVSSCKKSKKSEDTPATPTPAAPVKKYALVIDNGAQSIEVGRSINLTAHLVSTSGAVVSAPNISWSSNIGGVSGASFSFNNDTTGIISASVQYDGVNYSASVPISVQPIKSTQLFAVVPSAIIWDLNSGSIPLETIYLGGSATYAFSSQNSNIASVSSTGIVSFNSVGNTNIIVNATINGQPHQVVVPVMVVGTPEITLPVSRIVVTPALGELFKGETLQLTAKAFNSAGTDVSNTVTFNYSFVQKAEDDNETANPISITNNGLVSAVAIGGAYVQVTANGVLGQCEIVVNPDTAIVINPFYTQLGGFDPITFQPNPTDKIFTASTYKVNRVAYRAGSSNFLTPISNPNDLIWSLPEVGIPSIDNIFKVVTLSNTTTTSAKATAISGKFGLTTIIASSKTAVGAAAILVNP